MVLLSCSLTNSYMICNHVYMSVFLLFVKRWRFCVFYDANALRNLYSFLKLLVLSYDRFYADFMALFLFSFLILFLCHFHLICLFFFHLLELRFKFLLPRGYFFLIISAPAGIRTRVPTCLSAKTPKLVFRCRKCGMIGRTTLPGHLCV